MIRTQPAVAGTCACQTYWACQAKQVLLLRAGDGNLVVYRATAYIQFGGRSGSAVWASGSYGVSNNGPFTLSVTVLPIRWSTLRGCPPASLHPSHTKAMCEQRRSGCCAPATYSQAPGTLHVRAAAALASWGVDTGAGAPHDGRVKRVVWSGARRGAP